MESKTVELFEEHILGPLKNLIRKHHEETKVSSATSDNSSVASGEPAKELAEEKLAAGVVTHGDPSTVAFHPTPKATNP